MTDRPLRVCMVTTFYPPYSFGGDGNFVHQLSNALARRGHHVEVIHCVDSYNLLSGKKSSGTYQDHANVTVHGLKSGCGFLSPLATQQLGAPLFKAKRIREILDRGFDVIHYHNISLIGGPRVLEYGQGIKLYTMHEYWLVCPTHMLFKYNEEACTKPSCLSCTLSHRRPPQLWRYSGQLAKSLEHVDAFLAPSRHSARIHASVVPPGRLVHMPNFAAKPHSETNAPTPLVREPYFLFVGRLEKLKGLQTVIPHFLKEGSTRLVIAGTGNHEADLRRLAGNSDRIQFLGHVTGPALRALYRNAIAVVVPSLCPEVFPLVVLEAFQQQTPVVVRNQGGLPEMVEENGGGFIFSSDDELAAALHSLQTDPNCRDELGQRGFAAYQSIWNEEAHLERYLELIQAIMTRNGQVPGNAREAAA